jgi:hypothetical protein
MAGAAAGRYDRPMTDDGTQTIEYDRWEWHTAGKFPKKLPPEQGFVHIGLYLTWLVERDFLDAGWIRAAGAGQIVAAIKSGSQTGSALREAADGALTSEMVSAEGLGFSTAYYLPEYGYARDYRGVFGRRADYYAVADDRESYGQLSPLLDERYEVWLGAGKPEVMPAPARARGWLSFLRPGQR